MVLGERSGIECLRFVHRLQGPFLFLGETGAIGIDSRSDLPGRLRQRSSMRSFGLGPFVAPTIRQLAWKKRRPIIWKFTEICLSLCELFGIIFCFGIWHDLPN